MKLNLGCGLDKRSGYLNVDCRPQVRPDRVADMRRLPWVADNSVEEIAARDVLEHVGWREIPGVLREWARVLEPGGRLVLQLPNLCYLADRYLHRRDTGEFVRWIYGDQDYPENQHRSGFDEESLRRALAQVGFEIETLGTDGGANLLCTARKPRGQEMGTGALTDKAPVPLAPVPFQREPCGS
jgi:predicted SAM-dependent methyltransferase